VLDFVAPESDWLDVRWCAEDDDAGFYRELPDAEVIWHVLRPLSGADLRRGVRLRLVHKLGAGVNTIDVATATKCGIAVANMPGANAPSVAEGTVLLMLAALRRLPGRWIVRFAKGAAGRQIRNWARRCATSAAAPSGWSATATSPSG
jgi:phosphoglycerate dehydrogenase-like enzyme